MGSLEVIPTEHASLEAALSCLSFSTKDTFPVFLPSQQCFLSWLLSPIFEQDTEDQRGPSHTARAILFVNILCYYYCFRGHIPLCLGTTLCRWLGNSLRSKPRPSVNMSFELSPWPKGEIIVPISFSGRLRTTEVVGSGWSTHPPSLARGPGRQLHRTGSEV